MLPETDGLHQGVDLTVPSGTDLRAPYSGTVIQATNDLTGNFCGGYIRLDHGNDTETKYCHLSSVEDWVTIGDEVEKGQKIGETGGDNAAHSPNGVDDRGLGNSDYAHLHYEVLHHESQVNPDDEGYLAVDVCAADDEEDEEAIAFEIDFLNKVDTRRKKGVCYDDFGDRINCPEDNSPVTNDDEVIILTDKYTDIIDTKFAPIKVDKVEDLPDPTTVENKFAEVGDKNEDGALYMKSEDGTEWIKIEEEKFD